MSSLSASGSASQLKSSNGNGNHSHNPTVFEQQREELVQEIALRRRNQGMESVLQNINRLNRNLESIIAVGNEFGSVEALWSQFENFMGKSEGEALPGNNNTYSDNKNNNNDGTTTLGENEDENVHTHAHGQQEDRAEQET